MYVINSKIICVICSVVQKKMFCTLLVVFKYTDYDQMFVQVFAM
jgi:hypothetical protein